jgi:hypothetical protein
MAGYTKLFGTIVTSTVWQEDAETKVIWITLLALVDKNGVVEATIPGIAHIAKVSIEKVEQAMNKFLSPDHYSRSSEFEGRRIEKVDGGYLILNYSKYRAKMRSEERQEYQRKYMQNYRQKNPVNSNVNFVSQVNQNKPIAEAKAEAKAETLKKEIYKEKKKFLDFVLLTEDEYASLIEKFGKAEADSKINTLNNYIGSKGTKYKSHYHTILNWSGRQQNNVSGKNKAQLEFERLLKEQDNG